MRGRGLAVCLLGMAASWASWAGVAHADGAIGLVSDGDGAGFSMANSPDGSAQCLDRTDVVGYRKCPAYGEWGENLLAPYVFVEIGVNVWHFAAAAAVTPAPGSDAVRSLSPTSMGGRGGAGTGEGAGLTSLVTYDERVGVGTRLGLYAALDLELGGIMSEPATSSALLALLSVGIQHRLGPITLSGEVTGGLLAYTPETSTALSDQRILVARGRADLWLTPWFTFGGTAGRSLADDGWMAGLVLGFHTHAYGRR